MGLQQELKTPNPFSHKPHEAMLNILFTGTLLMREGAALLRPYGLTVTQFNILMLLKYQSINDRINQTRLGDMLLIYRSNITGIIDRMEKADLVRRTADSGDRRVNYVEMTENGKSILEKAHKVYHTRLDEIMAAVSDADNEHICSSLELIRKPLW
ncbi:MarR family winged helix-turn-helix transcriptional regulator [Candidatus Latescibacterota bacterium]